VRRPGRLATARPAAPSARTSADTAAATAPARPTALSPLRPSPPPGRPMAPTNALARQHPRSRQTALRSCAGSPYARSGLRPNLHAPVLPWKCLRPAPAPARTPPPPLGPTPHSAFRTPTAPHARHQPTPPGKLSAYAPAHDPTNLGPQLRSTRECREHGGGPSTSKSHSPVPTPQVISPPRSLHSLIS